MEEESQWIAAASRGNKMAFRRLVEKYQQYVFTVALRMVCRRELAEEIAQDVFLKVYQTLDTFEGKSRFSTWLYTITYRTAIDELRKRSLPTSELKEKSGAALPDHLHEDGWTRTHRQDVSRQLQRAIEQLDTADATIVTLYYLQEQSVKEIATITGLTETNIKTKLFRLRNKLRENLTQQLGEEIMHLL